MNITVAKNEEKLLTGENVCLKTYDDHPSTTKRLCLIISLVVCGIFNNV